MTNELTNKTVRTDIYKIDPKNIVIEQGFNSRTDFGDIEGLAEQIKKQGVLNPISVIPFKDENGEDKYRLVDGERRYRAVMHNINNGFEIARVPALFLSARSVSKEELFIQQAMRNEGKPFTEYEYGILAKKMIDVCGLTVHEVAEKLGKNEGGLIYALQDLEYDERVQDLLRKNLISGPQVRRVYSQHKNDEKGAIDELLGLKDAAEKNGRKKLSLKDLSLDGKTILSKDSKTIKDGMVKLFEYLKKAGYDTNDMGELGDILNGLKEGKLINEILNLNSEQLKQAV